MSINRALLWSRVSDFVDAHYTGEDIVIIKELLCITIESDPTKYCIIKGSKKDWEGLPPAKSLFKTRKGCGLPIGNLTSQVFANFYMNIFDHYVKHDLNVRYYGRYVDDIILCTNLRSI